MHTLVGSLNEGDRDSVDVHLPSVHDAKEFYERLLAQNSPDCTGVYNGFTYQDGTDPYEFSSTRYFKCLELVVPLLYWYNAFHGMLSRAKCIICPMALQNGLVIVAHWRSRCSAPVIHAVIFNVATGLCSLMKTGWHLLLPDSTLLFDRDMSFK